MIDWIYGKHAVLETLKSGRPVEKILLAKNINKFSVNEIIEHAKKQNVPFQWVPRTRLDQLAEGNNHQGVVAQVAAFEYASLEDLFERAEQKQEAPFFLLLDSIEDPHNLGSILRSADASGVHGVIIPKRRAAGVTSVVAKTSAGAVQHVPVVRVTNLNRVADELKERGVWLVGSDGSAEQEYTRVDYKMPVAMVIGNEGRGIHSLLKKKCDYLVKLPMRGKVSSLNASVAAGILMYEVMRCRMNDG
ncbi:23S rRNA (guanosine(2251)-2'-O)-methyltransferase RlmB [Thermoactinomyces intermedius]|jgi:23S rRNA (guanosine2251-2'-O)-methyltransferase|uniref:23S rRNA (Guanosine(2251)-2'-O)-methyltransferase RlmB n=1 Tax=Thermoactinomyces intermedius TaxID=2024 RepID=A0A8I1A4S2_THEIN|nr:MULTISPECIES: 23S rRNA (guanosine(2251)-2'-O)-methyltransferase RlmB [Thermoactinomyces]MBA4549356.1 23S rRNA (guanosine(2251)-2'-O)-methyltransferase RlmB [Thermoactinomyces intermedius]MBA4837279.1 23S rRNA (guanosine(2251)-2'-O)-methyltransferase RlmB [Thermoactinomyces intermedius]MBH8595637.1 23S rRNA (guanosine(2251)-2'-O)-methyltransferase RlmB [Thermoactinomyces intermedius]MBH8600662.1 23S rRNA (guanosine(2251)-2'-O)-methyltransferase RlmB [Thermoactinomyces sp. CICC 23799]